MKESLSDTKDDNKSDIMMMYFPFHFSRREVRQSWMTENPTVSIEAEVRGME